MVNLVFTPFFIGWIIISLICAIIGSKRRTGFWGSFWLAMILSPFLVLIMLMIFQPVKKGK